MVGEKKRILIVDDSAFVRQSFKDIINSDPELEVMGVANDPFFAAKKIREEVPDAITLDIEMPRMDGLAFLRKIMAQHPIPVVIISSLTAESAEITLRALEYGAVGVVNKPNMFDKVLMEEARIQICDAIKAATRSRIRRRQRPVRTPEKTVQLDQLPSLGITHSKSLIKTTEKVIAVGASTGGTEALKDFLLEMPVDCPGIVIVQHMPEMFTKSFAQRLNELCNIQVKEAENGDNILRGHALIAPGNKHLRVKRSGARYFVEVSQGPLVNRHRPSVDVLFRSVAEYVGANAIGVIMTGMGGDGSKGMLEMHRAGAYTVAQDEESCVVFGMPKEAIKLGGVSKILPLKNIANHINKMNF